jgi:hypothetical protein
VSQTTGNKTSIKDLHQTLCLPLKKINASYLGHVLYSSFQLLDMFSTPPFRGLIRAVNQSEKLLNQKLKSSRIALHPAQ